MYYVNIQCAPASFNPLSDRLRGTSQNDVAKLFGPFTRGNTTPACQESAAKDYRADLYFGQLLFESLPLSTHVKKPDVRYLRFHRENIFKG